MKNTTNYVCPDCGQIHSAKGICKDPNTGLCQKGIMYIKWPSDSCTYEIYSRTIINENTKITIENIAGTKEECKWKVIDGVIHITTPIWVTNPSELKITFK